MVRVGYVGAGVGILILLGHGILFAMLANVPTVSANDLADLRAYITPVTSASVATVVLWAIDTRHKKLSETKEINWFFTLIAFVIPLFLLWLCGSTIRALATDSLVVSEAKSTIAYSEAFFGLMISLILKAVYEPA